MMAVLRRIGVGEGLVKNNKFIRAVLTVIALSYTPAALSAPKEYQKLLMDEPASLFDLMIFKADLELDSHIRSISKTKPFKLWEMSKWRWDWLRRPPKPGSFTRPVYFKYGHVDFDFEKGNFIVGATAIWKLFEFIELADKKHIETHGKLKNNQKNIASMCELLLIELSKVAITPITHRGFSTHKSRKLPKFGDLYKTIKNDSVYKVTIYIQHDGEDLPSMTCSTPGPIHDRSDDVSYQFYGDWHKLDEIEKRERRPQDFL